MATVTKKLNFATMAYVSERYPSTHYTLSSGTWYAIDNEVFDKPFLFTLESFPSNIRHKKLIGIQFRAQFKTPVEAMVVVYRSASGFDASNVTYYTSPKFEAASVTSVDIQTGIPATDLYVPESLNGTYYEARSAWRALSAGSLSFLCTFCDASTKNVLKSGATPYANVKYDDAVTVLSKIAYKSGPISGYSNPRFDTVFGWDYVKDGENVWCAEEAWDQADATFYWKASTSENYTAVAAGTSKSVTIPANTFPINSTIQWYVVGTDEDGTTTQTSVYTFSTSAGEVSTGCIDPVGKVIDGSADYTFRWSIASADGQPASRTALQWKPSTGDTWTTVFDENSALTSYVVPGGTLLPGPIDWRVLAYNVDGTLGSAATATFISVTAPNAVQGLAATAVPFSTITWQSTGQEAYQITVDGEVVAKEYGPTVYSYKLKEPLADGDHTISVTVQGIYELWSQPTEITVTIQNEPTEPIAITGTFGIDAALSWDLVQDLTYIYRDGKRIGATNGQNFTDRVSLGRHDYYVLAPLPDGNYNISNTVTGTTDVDCGQIALLSGGGWMPLEHCKELPVQTYTHSRTVSVRHYCGAAYPVAEVSEFYDRSGSFNVLFEESEAAILEKFEKLLGEIVIMKNRRNNILVGIFSTLDKRVEDFYTDCDFIVQQTEWNDFVNETNN